MDRTRRRNEGRGGACGLVLALSAAGALGPGCANQYEVAEGERRPDAAVEVFPPSAACEHEPRQVGEALADAEGRAAAALVRLRDRPVLVRLEPAGGASRIAIDSVERSGALRREGTVALEGEGRPRALSALVAGERLRLALTTEQGEVRLLSLSVDGGLEAAPVTLEARAEGAARLLWFRDGPLVELDGRVVRPGAPPAEAAPAPEGGAAEPASPLPEGGLVAVTAAGDALGWLHRDERGLWLSHQRAGAPEPLTVRLGPAEAPAPRLLWAGDRYLVGDPSLTTLSRYAVSAPRRAKQPSPPALGLSGRLVVPRPPGEVAHAAWDSSGPAHLGLAQALSARHLRFVNLALAGQVLDAPAHIRTEGEVTDLDVLWDGRGYVLLWAEAAGERRARLHLTRFVCPDDD